MTVLGLAGWAWLLAGGLLLGGCASAPPRADHRGAAGNAELVAAQQAREAEQYRQNQWSLSGRVAVRANDQGGSGGLVWRQSGSDFEITLSAPITRQGWRLSRRGDLTVLDGLAGGPQSGADPETLLMAATGWRLPVGAMTAWLRGLRANPDAEIEFGPAGLPAVIREQGWTVEYRDWDAQVPAMPRRIFASHDAASVRLVVERWDAP